jgi:hypothetical protein
VNGGGPGKRKSYAECWKPEIVGSDTDFFAAALHGFLNSCEGKRGLLK